MQDREFRRKLNIFFAWGFFLGALCFILIYGTNVLDVTYDSFVFRSDVDMRQHYLGWMAFRNSPWTFPLGVIDTLSYPTKMSIVLTDSIPLVAVIFKIMRGILPQIFQYFGPFVMLCFSLQGAFAARLIWRITKNNTLSIITPVLFIVSFPMLDRAFYHSSLTAQWIILLSFELWFSGIAEAGIKKQVLSWALLGFLCAGIHIYFLPMVFGIMCGCYLEAALKNNTLLYNINRIILSGVSMAVVAAAALWSFGGFVTASTGEYWIGEFGVNLLTFINPMERGRLLPSFELFTSTQSEGGAYLGASVLLVIGIAVVFLIYSLMAGKKGMPGVSAVRVFARPISIILISLVFCIVSVCPLICVGKYRLVMLPYPEPLLRLLGLFRANGRFIWPVYYLLLLLFCVILSRAVGLLEKSRLGLITNKVIWCLLLLGLVALQLFDLSPFIAKKHTHYALAKRWQYVTEFDRFNPDRNKYKHIISYEGDGSVLMAAGYFACREDFTLNQFYFARDIDEITNAYLDKYTEEIKNGAAREDCLYVLDRRTYEELKNAPLHFYKGEKVVLATKDAVEGKSELKEGELDEIEWPEA